MKLAAAPTRSQPARQEAPPIVRNRVPGGHPRFFSGGYEIYGNYLDEVWTLDNRAGGITVANLNNGSGNQRHFYHCNSLYHVYGLTDEAGALKEAYQYDAYGKQTVITDGNDGDSIVNFSGNDTRTVGGNSLISNPYMYTGQRFDPETGLMYYKNRYYSAELGRFVSRDPIGYRSGVEGLYEYVKSNPKFWYDPLGLRKLTFTVVFNDDWKTSTAGYWHRTGSGLHGFAEIFSEHDSFTQNFKTLDDAIDWIIKKGNWYDPGGLRKDCIQKIIFAGHGWGGDWGFDDSAKDKKKGKKSGPGGRVLEGDDLTKPDSAATRAFKKLSGKWCTSTNEGIELQICGQAADGGRTVMENLSVIVGAKVKGWDDWYYGFPTGREFTAFPTGTSRQTGDTGYESGGNPPLPTRKEWHE